MNFANSPIFIETLELCSFRIDHALFLMPMYSVQQRQAVIWIFDSVSTFLLFFPVLVSTNTNKRSASLYDILYIAILNWTVSHIWIKGLAFSFLKNCRDLQRFKNHNSGWKMRRRRAWDQIEQKEIELK